MPQSIPISILPKQGVNHARFDLSPFLQCRDHGARVGINGGLAGGGRQTKTTIQQASRAPRSRLRSTGTYRRRDSSHRGKSPQINRLFVQDFVIYAHSELDMVKKLLDREPALLNAAMDWGSGDWETGSAGRRTWAAAISSSTSSTAAHGSTSSVPP